MRKPLLLGSGDLDELEGRAKVSKAYAAEVRTILGGRFRAEIAEFYGDAPGRVSDFITEIRRLRGELQQSLRLTVARVDADGKARHGDVGEAGKKRRGKRRTDVDDAGKERRGK